MNSRFNLVDYTLDRLEENTTEVREQFEDNRNNLNQIIERERMHTRELQQINANMNNMETNNDETTRRLNNIVEEQNNLRERFNKSVEDLGRDLQGQLVSLGNLTGREQQLQRARLEEQLETIERLQKQHEDLTNSSDSLTRTLQETVNRLDSVEGNVEVNQQNVGNIDNRVTNFQEELQQLRDIHSEFVDQYIDSETSIRDRIRTIQDQIREVSQRSDSSDDYLRKLQQHLAQEHVRRERLNNYFHDRIQDNENQMNEIRRNIPNPEDAESERVLNESLIALDDQSIEERIDQRIQDRIGTSIGTNVSQIMQNYTGDSNPQPSAEHYQHLHTDQSAQNETAQDEIEQDQREQHEIEQEDPNIIRDPQTDTQDDIIERPENVANVITDQNIIQGPDTYNIGLDEDSDDSGGTEPEIYSEQVTPLHPELIAETPNTDNGEDEYERAYRERIEQDQRDYDNRIDDNYGWYQLPNGTWIGPEDHRNRHNQGDDAIGTLFNEYEHQDGGKKHNKTKSKKKKNNKKKKTRKNKNKKRTVKKGKRKKSNKTKSKK